MDVLTTQIFGLAVWVLLLIIGGLAALTYFGIKVLPIKKKQTAGMLAAVCIIAGLFGGGYLGTLGNAASATGGTGATNAAGVTVPLDVVGSESDTNLTYNSANTTFSCNFYENITTPDACTSADADIDTLTLTLTIWDESAGASDGDNQMSVPVVATVETFKGEGTNSASTYYPVQLDTTVNEYKVAMTPAGGSARNEKTTAIVPFGSSKAVAIVLTLDDTSLAQLDNGEFVNVWIKVGDLSLGQNEQTFTVRLTKIGEIV